MYPAAARLGPICDLHLPYRIAPRGGRGAPRAVVGSSDICHRVCRRVTPAADGREAGAGAPTDAQAGDGCPIRLASKLALLNRGLR
eukprot:scaffold133234_cov66-Phaeocystis_antarctica.AAC.3